MVGETIRVSLDIDGYDTTVTISAGAIERTLSTN